MVIPSNSSDRLSFLGPAVALLPPLRAPGRERCNVFCNDFELIFAA
jgi:hypothetical protein